MSHTPLRSPIKVSASQSQEDIKGYEVINQPLHEEEGGEEEQQETDGIRSDDMPPPGTQIKPSESQPRVHDQHMDVDDVPESVPQPAPVADQRTQQTRTPELTQRHIQRISAQRSPSSPGRLDPFDWEDFESRYQKALAEADQEEGELLAEFEHLVKTANPYKICASVRKQVEAKEGAFIGGGQGFPERSSSPEYIKIRSKSPWIHRTRPSRQPSRAFPTTTKLDMSSTFDTPGVLKAPGVSQVRVLFTSRTQQPMANPEQTEIEAFHAEHFSVAAIQLFAGDFLQPQPNHEDECYGEYYDYEEDDDGLGYYPDGVKRTLTDEQIAIFRHSELEALRREEEKKAAKASNCPQEGPGTAEDGLEASNAAGVLEPEFLEETEDGEIESESPQPASSAPSKAKRRRKAKKNRQSSAKHSESLPRGEQGWFKKTIKPDLRKRTWDVVETGMDSLDYDGLEASAGSGTGQASQRRKISYDD
ncbi:hypothetical protein SCUP515_06597 [Seiridium cupressi]